jgi:hypothetical protein
MRVESGPHLVGGELGVAEQRFAVVVGTDNGPVTHLGPRGLRPERVIAWMVTPAGRLITVPAS